MGEESREAPRVLIVGAGFAAFHCARRLERVLAPGEAQVTLASPVDYMLYSPLLPHVAAGILGPADIAVPLRAPCTAPFAPRAGSSEST